MTVGNAVARCAADDTRWAFLCRGLFAFTCKTWYAHSVMAASCDLADIPSWPPCSAVVPQPRPVQVDTRSPQDRMSYTAAEEQERS